VTNSKDKPLRILVPFGCRSDMGLSTPVVKRMKEAGMDAQLINLFPQDFKASYNKMDGYCEGTIGARPDLVFITGDRVEMTAAACAAFHNGIPIAHYYAGCVNEPPTVADDTNRHCITLWSTIQFCENMYAAGVVCDLKYACGLKPKYHIVGISHLEDMEIDESKVPYAKPYDLYLINPEPNFKAIDVPYDLNNARIQIGANPDGHVDKIPDAVYYGNLPRAQFFGLLKNCQHFITNSSAAYYEAPFFLKPDQIIMVGLRNRNRHAVTMNTGASDKIVKIISDTFK
jgi:hypothetical protein